MAICCCGRTLPKPRSSRLQQGVAAFPPDFYSFARPTGEPQHPLDITFASPEGAQVKLVGYDVLPDPQWRSTAFRFYWQAVTPLPEGTTLRVFFVTPDGREVDSTDQRPLIQPLWIPPETWPVGETIVTSKLSWYLPKQWAPAVGVFQGDTWDDPARRWRVGDAVGATGVFDNASWAALDGWQWRGRNLEPLPPPSLRRPTPPSPAMAGPCSSPACRSGSGRRPASVCR